MQTSLTSLSRAIVVHRYNVVTTGSPWCCLRRVMGNRAAVLVRSDSDSVAHEALLPRSSIIGRQV